MSDFLDMDLDFTGVDNAPPPPLPRGTYSARVVDITKKPAKPSTDGRETFSQVWIQVEVEDKKITDFISLHPQNKWKLRAALEAITGQTLDGPVSTSLFQELIGAEVNVVLGQKGRQNDPRIIDNFIESYV